MLNLRYISFHLQKQFHHSNNSHQQLTLTAHTNSSHQLLIPTPHSNNSHHYLTATALTITSHLHPTPTPHTYTPHLHPTPTPHIYTSHHHRPKLQNSIKRPNNNLVSNFRDLLIFWQDHYLHKDKDCSALEKVNIVFKYLNSFIHIHIYTNYVALLIL